jgi:alpha-L-rhamnosidase
MATLILGLLLAAGAPVGVRVSGLRCEYADDPLGIASRRPRLSWVIESDRRGERQTAYRVLVASSGEGLARGEGDLWDTGRVESDRSTRVVYGGRPLVSRQAAFWKVRVWDGGGSPLEWSPPARFELGLLDRSDWRAEWIGAPPPGESAASPPATLLRKEVAAGRAVRRARLYASARGVYELFLNGHRVGEDLFRPGWTDYRHRIQSQTYDVGELLQEGTNALGVVLGDGWYRGHVGASGRMSWGRVTRALVQLEIEREDGTRERIVSDGSWRAYTGGPIRMSDLLMGETYDARLDMPGWAGPGFDDGGWTAAQSEPLGDVPVVPQRGPSVREVLELKPVSVEETPPGSGTFVFDMGQNMVGWARLHVEGAAGQTVRLRFAERLEEDGAIYTANLRGARATDRYTLRGGGPEVYEPTFTFHGFRYVEVTGYPGTPRIDALTGVVISSLLERTGAFETSNDMINQLQSNIVWSQRGSSLEVPTDGPQRDERVGGMGDAQLFARTACFNFDVMSFLEKWLQDVHDAQNPAGGFPNLAPDPPRAGDAAEGNDAGAPAWGDAGVIVPWTLYRCYGDARVLEESFPAMTRWIAFLQEANPDLLWVERSGPDFGDWLNVDADTPLPVLATAYFARSAFLAARTAEVLGETEKTRAYDALFDEIREAFGRAYVKADGRVEGETQTASLLALAFDLLPDETRPLTVRHLVTDIEGRDVHLSTGVVGAHLINPVLSDVGRIDLAYRLLLTDTFPSWGYSVRHGATTIWERWDGWTAETGFQDTAMNSFNHYALGSVGEWMYAVVAGIDLDPERPGYKRVVLRPRPGGGLTHASGELRSLYGLILSDWTIEHDLIHWVVEVPPNTTATAHVPTSDPARVTEGGRPAGEVDGLRLLREEATAAVYELGSGWYEFEAPAP